MSQAERGCGNAEAPTQTNVFESLTPAQIKERCVALLKTATDPEEILLLQRGVLQFTAYLNPDDVDGLYDIRIVERNEQRPAGEACTDYIIGHGVDAQAFHDDMLANFTETEKPTPGAYALYTQFGLIPKHIGRVTDNGTVISKWGQGGHVYEHKPLMVPLSYGDTITYYSSPKIN